MNGVHPFLVEHIAPGVIREHCLNGELDVFVVENSNPQTIDVWTNSVKTTIENWPKQTPCLLLHDFHQLGMFAYDAKMPRAFLSLFKSHPDLERFVAVVMPDSSTAEITTLACRVRELTVAYDYPIHWDIFTNRKQALQWLLTHTDLAQH